MTFFKNVMNKLFPQKGETNQIVHSQLIDRSKPYSERYYKWIDSYATEVYHNIHHAYQEKLSDQANSLIQVHLLLSKYSNGLAISFDPDHFSKETFSFLFDHLGAKSEQLENYRKVNADYLIREKNGRIETKEKYYLKPLPSKNDSIVDQQFGNILIEHILIDDRPSYIKLMANVYSDSNYGNAQSFDDLVSKILK